MEEMTTDMDDVQLIYVRMYTTTDPNFFVHTPAIKYIGGRTSQFRSADEETEPHIIALDGFTQDGCCIFFEVYTVSGNAHKRIATFEIHPHKLEFTKKHKKGVPSLKLSFRKSKPLMSPRNYATLNLSKNGANLQIHYVAKKYRENKVEYCQIMIKDMSAH